MIDQFFTPHEIASSALKGLQLKDFKVVADFAVGNGSLIKALPFEPETVIGVDLDNTVIEGLRVQYPNWKLSKGDFIDPTSSTKAWLNEYEKNIDLIVLNPPFSCKGGKRYPIEIDHKVLKCRTALAFVVRSLKYLKPTGALYAILPLSCLKSESDVDVLNHLKENWKVEIGRRFSRTSFKGCYPHSILLTFQRKFGIDKITELSHNMDNFCIEAEVIRGSTQMFKTRKKGKYKVIHTSNLNGGRIAVKGFKYSNVKKKAVQGEFLCLPRVGSPNRNKVALINIEKCHLISDCIIAIRGRTSQETRLIRDLLFEYWCEFKSLYESTCAPYITMRQVCDFLRKFHVLTQVVEQFDNNRFLIETLVSSSEVLPSIKYDNVQVYKKLVV